MFAPKFVQEYPATLSPGEIHPYGAHPMLEEARDWSHRLGQLLHGRLSCGIIDSEQFTGDLTEYQEWALGFHDLEIALLTDPTMRPEDRMMVNFHALNRHMTDMWQPLRLWGWRPGAEDRDRRLRTSQNSIALEGLFYYLARQETLAQYGGDPAIFDPTFRPLYDLTAAIMNEYDAANTALEVARQQRCLTIVPAPMQFERGRNNACRNVDLLVIDVVNRRAVGGQVKSSVTRSAVEGSDKERVVFIDGKRDLGNVRRIRPITGEGSREVTCAWPGYTSLATIIEQLPDNGKELTLAAGKLTPGQVRSLKEVARASLGEIKVDRTAIATQIGTRLLAKMYPTTPS